MNVSILINGVCVIFIRNEAWFMRVAVFADIDGRAYFAVVVTSGSVNGASLVSNILFMDEFEGIECGSPVAPIISSITRDDYLRRNVDVRPLSISCDLYSIGER
jgi:hypothetical protein